MSERGSASVLASVLVVVLATSAVVATGMTRMVLAERQAQSAADLAALAGASALQGGEDGCAAAARTAEANHAELTSCRVNGQDVVLRARVEVGSVFGMRWRLAGHARAGPMTG